MKNLPHLFENNKSWAARIKKEDPGFFEKLSDGQNPPFLWIGCSDSRVPANEIVGLPPGDLFVHRNIANLVVHSDMNCQSVIQYAVEVLRVKHVIVCGHYKCGGVQAALQNNKLGLIDNWLRNLKELYQSHKSEIEAINSKEERLNKMCELNVQAQVFNVCHTPFVQEAWANGHDLWVHGWIYSLSDGLLKDLDLCIGRSDIAEDIFTMK